MTTAWLLLNTNVPEYSMYLDNGGWGIENLLDWFFEHEYIGTPIDRAVATEWFEHMPLGVMHDVTTQGDAGYTARLVRVEHPQS